MKSAQSLLFDQNNQVRTSLLFFPFITNLILSFFVSAFPLDEKNYFRITCFILFFMYINFLFYFQFIFSFYFQYSIFFSSMVSLQRFCLKLQISRIWTINLWNSSIRISKQVYYVYFFHFIHFFVSLLFFIIKLFL